MKSTLQYNTQKVLILVSLLFLVLAVFEILLFQKQNDFSGGKNNILYVLDVSLSMNVEDSPQGDSRLRAGKRKIVDIVNEMSGHNFALNIFAGESIRVLPFTNDAGLLTTFLLGLDSNNITQQGSDILSALRLSVESFSDQESGKILLLSDGNEQQITLPRDIKQAVQDNDLDVIILGVGSSAGGYIPSNSPLSRYKLYEGEIVVSKLQEENLRDIAQQLGGTYFPLNEFTEYDIIGESKTSSNLSYMFLIFTITFFLYVVATYKKLFSRKF